MPGYAEYEGLMGCLGAGVAGKASRTQSYQTARQS